MNYNIEQLNILFEKMQKDLEGVIALSVIAFILSLLMLCAFIYFVLYEIRIEKK